MKRSDFLKTVGLVSLAPAAMSFKAAQSTGEKGKVIIIGAGISGLAAAKRLKAAGYETIVIEARKRVGGRIWTDDSLGTPIDMGASYIHGERDNPLTSFVNEYSINTRKVDHHSVHLYDERYGELDDLYLEEIYKETHHVLNKAYRYGNHHFEDITMNDAIDHVLQTTKLDNKYKPFLDWSASVEELREGEFDKMSTWGDRDIGHSGPDRLFPSGFQQIIKELGKGIDVRLNEQVKEVNYDNDKVTVITSTMKYEGDYCICTLPLGVLKTGDVKFAPGLPETMKKAIQWQGMTTVNKVAVKYSGIEWTSDKQFIGHGSSFRGDFPIFTNWGFFSNQPYLLAWVGGEFGRSLENFSDKEIFDKVNTKLKNMFRGKGEVEEVKVTRWLSDKFSEGAFSYLPVGQKGLNADILAEPQGRCRFAGEHTYRHYIGTAHGAYMSGMREADRIIGA